MIITLFKSLVDTKTPHYKDIHYVFDLIKSGGKHGDIVDKIRTTKDKDEKDRLKRSLPIALFSGKFKERKAEGLDTYNRLIVLDLDDVKNADVRKMELESLPYVFACWKSPSNGLKVLVKVLTDDHLAHFLALSKDIKGVDPSGKDICRATFLSKDPSIYINKDATVYDKVVVTSFTESQRYENLKKWLENKGSYFQNGQRNSFITKLASAANRFGIEKEFLKEKLEEDFLKGSDFSKREMEVTVNGIYQRYADQFASVSAEEVWTDDKVSQVLSDNTGNLPDVIYLRDVRVDIISDYDNGIQLGPQTHFPSVDKIWRRVPGQLNTLVGIGNQGKSTWQQQLDIVDAVKSGGKFAYFGPEGYPAKRWYRQLIQAVGGKTMKTDSPKRMTKTELDKAMDFIDSHFIYVYPPVVPTPEYIIERFVEAIIKHGLKGVTVDPWNQLFHSMAKRDDIYVAEVLTKFERFAQIHEVLVTVIVHPNKTNKGEDGNYQAPDVYDINGGPVWNARSSNICTYHRPYYSTNPDDTSCQLIYRKIKDQDLMGVPGTVELMYDRNTYRFYDNGFSPLADFKL
jgi:hypothetical protein